MEEQKRLCDWCGAPAETTAYRTLYAGTECEQTGKYFECSACRRKATAELLRSPRGDTGEEVRGRRQSACI